MIAKTTRLSTSMAALALAAVLGLMACDAAVGDAPSDSKGASDVATGDVYLVGVSNMT